MSDSSFFSRRTIILLSTVGLLIVIVASLSIVSMVRASNNVSITAQQGGISVCGTGKVQAVPDLATVSIGVQARATTAEDARAKAATTMDSVLKAIKDNGIVDKDIKTGYVSINPDYIYKDGTTAPSGYIATNYVTVTMHDTNKVSAVIDSSTKAGGNNISINGVQFSISDSSKAQKEAQQKALADAKSQATELAQGAGVSLGQPLSISVGTCGNQVIVPTYANSTDSKSAAGSSPSTPIQPGQNEVSVVVGVIYAIR
jgi:uncharacterized protein YggE